MTRSMRLFSFLILAALSSSTHAFFDTPILSPTNPVAGQQISISTRAGDCHLFEGGPTDGTVTTNGNQISIAVPARINAFCNFPITTRTYIVGSFPPGDYTLNVYYQPGVLSGGGPPRLMGLLAFNVAPLGAPIEVPIPSLSFSSKLLLVALCAAAAVAQYRRKSLVRSPGPAIKMDPADHHETSSNGRRRLASKLYRDDLKAMIDDGRMRDATATEVRDVCRASQLVSSSVRKHNQAMQQMLDYAKGQGWLDKGEKGTTVFDIRPYKGFGPLVLGMSRMRCMACSVRQSVQQPAKAHAMKPTSTCRFHRRALRVADRSAAANDQLILHAADLLYQASNFKRELHSGKSISGLRFPWRM